jgi:recombination protein RecA
MSKKIPGNNQPTTDTTSNLSQTFNELEKQLEKLYGKGSIMMLNNSTFDSVPAIPTGSFGLDMYLGIGGFPRGRFTEIFGHEGSGKTTISLQAIAQAQKQGILCAFIDTEHALNINYARNLGVDVNSLIISQPDSGEQALGILETLIKSNESGKTNGLGLIVLDSVASLTPLAELNGEMGDSHIGLQARLISQALRKIVAHVSNNNVAVIFINQTRCKIGITFPGASGETTTGGTSLKFYCSVRLEVKKIGTLFKMFGANKKVIGSRTLIKVVKNKMASPFKEIKIDLIYGKGTSVASEIFDLATDKEYDFNLIQQSGSWYQYKDQKLSQGRENVITELENNPVLLKELKDKILLIYAEKNSFSAPINNPVEINNANNILDSE